MKPRIYLDIDHVLNCDQGNRLAKMKFPAEWSQYISAPYPNRHLAHKFWHKPCVDSLKKIIKETGCEIYIHSSWRRHFDLKEFKMFFENWGIDPDVIAGVIPFYKLSSQRYHDVSWHIGGERILSEDTDPCENYVVIDDYDMSDIFDCFKDQIVTSRQKGLTSELANRAVMLLKNV